MDLVQRWKLAGLIVRDRISLIIALDKSIKMACQQDCFCPGICTKFQLTSVKHVDSCYKMLLKYGITCWSKNCLKILEKIFNTLVG